MAFDTSRKSASNLDELTSAKALSSAMSKCTCSLSRIVSTNNSDRRKSKRTSVNPEISSGNISGSITQ